MKEKIKLLLLTYLQENTDTFLSAKALSDVLDVSERTIYRYIKLLNQDLALRGIEILSLPGVGYRLEHATIENQLVDVVAMVEPERELEIEYSIIERLFFCKSVPVEQMLREYYISESTLYRILQSINEKYSLKGGRLGVRKGHVLVKGELEEVVYFFIGLFISLEIQNRKELVPSVFLKKDEANQWIKEIYEGFSFSSYPLSEFDSRIMLWAIYVLSFRCGKMQLMKAGQLLSMKDTEWYVVLQMILEKIIRLNDKALHQSLERITDLTLTFFNTPHSSLSGQSKHIRANLITHLKLVLKQKSFGIQVENSLMHVIEDKYAFELAIAGLLVYQLELTFGFPFTKADIGFIALYLATMQQQRRKLANRVRAVLVSESLSSGYLLKEELSVYFPELEINAVITEWELEGFNFTECDFLIVTTGHELNTSLPVYYNKNPMDNLELFREGLGKKIAQLRVIHHAREMIQTPMLVTENAEEDIIRTMIYQKLGNTSVADKCIKEVIDREKISSTALSSGIAIPHTLSKNIEHSTVFLGIHEKGVNWKGKRVQLIILALFSEKDKFGGELFRKLYHFSSHHQMVKQTIQERTAHYLVHFLEGNIL